MLFELALKNLLRNFRRTLLVEISIVFGVIVIVFTGNFLQGMQRAWAQFEIGSNTGAFEAEHKDYKELRKSEPLKVTMDHGAELVERTSKIHGVSAAFGKLNFSGMVSSGVKSTFFGGVAVDVVRQKQTLPRQEDLIMQGKPISGAPGEVVLGADLANMLGIKIGDPVSIVVQTYYGTLNLYYGTLVGTKNGRHFPSSTYLEMNLGEAQNLLRVNDRLSQIVFATQDFDTIPDVMRRVETSLANEKTPFVVRGYAELIPVYPRAIAAFSIISLVVGIVLFVLVGGGIGNVMAMAVMERKREIGTIRALGMEQRQVRNLFLLEGAIAGAVGAVIGMLIVTALTVFVASQGGLNLPPVGGTSKGISILPELNTTINVFGLLMPTVVGVVAAWLPASWSARLSPVEALMEK